LNSEDLQGGALVADDSRTVVDQPGAWLVFLPLDVSHHVTRVERGERYVFTVPVFGVWVTTRDDNAARAPWRPNED
jgi:predicted 2-oxoglutarate/Fe(II)-dependent dioxygenase YbiX